MSVKIWEQRRGETKSLTFYGVYATMGVALGERVGF